MHFFLYYSSITHLNGRGWTVIFQFYVVDFDDNYCFHIVSCNLATTFSFVDFKLPTTLAQKFFCYQCEEHRRVSVFSFGNNKSDTFNDTKTPRQCCHFPIMNNLEINNLRYNLNLHQKIRKYFDKNYIFRLSFRKWTKYNTFIFRKLFSFENVYIYLINNCL